MKRILALKGDDIRTSTPATVIHLNDENNRLREEIEQLRVSYQELIMAVSEKIPNESRHETALRYILERERSSCDGAAKTDLTREEREIK
jgi:hypothetical protein